MTFVLTLLPPFQICSGSLSASRIYSPVGCFSPVFSPPDTQGEALGAGFGTARKARLRGISSLSSSTSWEDQGRQKRVLSEVPWEGRKGDGHWSHQGWVKMLREVVPVPLLEKFEVNWRVP